MRLYTYSRSVSCDISFILFPCELTDFIAVLFTHVYLSNRVLSITKHCLLSSAVKAHEEEEVGQLVTLHPSTVFYALHV